MARHHRPRPRARIAPGRPYYLARLAGAQTRLAPEWRTNGAARCGRDSPSALRYYIDPATARIGHSYDPANWKNRWLYHGLHSLDLPWLYAYRPLWDLVVITLLLGGTALSPTSIVLAWRVAGRVWR
jgi:hypothetical protein